MEERKILDKIRHEKKQRFIRIKDKTVTEILENIDMILNIVNEVIYFAEIVIKSIQKPMKEILL